MATRVDFKRPIRDFAQLEETAQVSLGTTGFAGDGDRLFLNFNDHGLLLSHEDAEAFLRGALRSASRLGYTLDDLMDVNERKDLE